MTQYFLNLWGELEAMPYGAKKPQGTIQKIRASLKYRPAETPKVSSCKYCQHRLRREYHDKYYNKCKQQIISMSISSDIKVSYICDLFKALEPGQKPDSD